MLINSNKNMTLKEYRKIQLVIVVIISIIFSQAIFYKNYIIPITVLVASSSILFYLRRSVKEIMADERDYAIGGKAALLAIQVYSWVAVVAMFIFYGLRDTNPAYEPIGMALAFSTCLLLILYALIFRYYDRISFSNKKFVYSVLAAILFLGLFVGVARLFSGEDDWICNNGQWVKHGNPSYPAPSVKCK